MRQPCTCRTRLDPSCPHCTAEIRRHYPPHAARVRAEGHDLTAAVARTVIGAAGILCLAWLTAAIFAAADRAADLRECAHHLDACIMETSR